MNLQDYDKARIDFENALAVEEKLPPESQSINNINFIKSRLAKLALLTNDLRQARDYLASITLRKHVYNDNETDSDLEISHETAIVIIKKHHEYTNSYDYSLSNLDTIILTQSKRLIRQNQLHEAVELLDLLISNNSDIANEARIVRAALYRDNKPFADLNRDIANKDIEWLSKQQIKSDRIPLRASTVKDLPDDNDFLDEIINQFRLFGVKSKLNNPDRAEDNTLSFTNK